VTQPKAVASVPPPAAPVTVPHPEAPMLAILMAPLAPGEPAFAGFQRKEGELRAAFAALSIIDAYHLRQRLANPRAGDALAEAFARLTDERRGRLLAFLGEARRRAALAGR
jgi:hypothetical protein